MEEDRAHELYSKFKGVDTHARQKRVKSSHSLGSLQGWSGVEIQQNTCLMVAC
jgi:hypothetical protein